MVGSVLERAGPMGVDAYISLVPTCFCEASVLAYPYPSDYCGCGCDIWVGGTVSPDGDRAPVCT